MAEYAELIKALRCPDFGDVPCSHPDCKYYDPYACKARVVITDAAAAIEALQAEIRESMQKCAECGAEPITLEQAIDRLHELGWLQEHDRILSQPHWVSVEDELPPMPYQAEGDDFCIDYSLLVLAYREASHDFWLARQMDDGHGATWGTDCFDELYGVTHWMPLPEPPKEDA